jgi:hypothetical protein
MHPWIVSWIVWLDSELDSAMDGDEWGLRVQQARHSLLLTCKRLDVAGTAIVRGTRRGAPGIFAFFTAHSQPLWSCV